MTEKDMEDVLQIREALDELAAKIACEQISEEQLNEILEAGTYAPTGMGAQCPVIVVIQDKKTRDYVSELNAKVLGNNTDPFYGAPTVLVVLAERSRGTHVDDGNMVIANLLNAAHAVGVDSCYIYRAREVFDSEEGKALLAKWGITGDYEGIGNVILGYGLPEGIKEAAPRKKDYIIRVKEEA